MTESKSQQGIILPAVVLGAFLLGLGFPFMLSGGIQDTHDDIVLLPRHTITPTPFEMALTQQAFALMFFTATNSPIPTSTETPNIFLPATGPTSTSTSTATFTATNTITASPTRTRLPVFLTLTQRGNDNKPPSTPVWTPSPNPTNTPIIISTYTASPVPTDPPPDTPTPEPTETPQPLPTDTPESPPGNNDGITGSSALGGFQQFALLYLLGAAFLGVLIRSK